jgi:hypothetical protein
MDHESFLDTVSSQYRDEIQSALADCEAGWRGGTNFSKLNRLLKRLMVQAKVDGLTQKEFIYLVEQVVPEGMKYLELLGGHAPPEDIRDHLNQDSKRKAA